MQIERVRVLTISVSMVGIIFLYGYSLTLVPDEIVSSEVSDHEGQYVRISGTVIELSDFSDTTYITLRDDHGTIHILVQQENNAHDKERELQVGDSIEVSGVVESYDRGFRIIVENFDSVRCVERWDGSTLTLAGLVSRPWELEGLNVNISCRIRVPITDSMGSAYAIIEDQNNENISLPVYVYGVDSQRGYRGESVNVNARFEYQERSFKFCLILDEPFHHIWPGKEESVMEESVMEESVMEGTMEGTTLNSV